MLFKQLREKKENYDSFIADNMFPLTQSQMGIFLSCERREGEIAYNNPLFLSFPKDFDEKRLSNAVEKTVKNHPGLFACIFLNQDGVPMMRYSYEFEKEDICNIVYAKESELSALKEGLIKPFLIKKDRLFRFEIIKTEKKTYLFTDIHHIVVDGYSLHVLLSEIIGSYEGKIYKKESFSAFHIAAKEIEERNGKDYASAKEWYLKEFADVEEMTIPQGDAKGNETVYNESKFTFDIEEEMQKYCAENDIKESAFTIGAFGYLLSLYTMNKKTAFATIHNGRQGVNTARTVAMTVKTLPVLCAADPTLSVKEYLSKLGEQIENALKKSVYSFSELTASSGYTDEVMFAYQGSAVETSRLNEKGIEREELSFNATGGKIIVQLCLQNDKLVFDVQYQRNLYSEEWIKCFAERYEKILKGFMTEKQLKDVSLVGKKEVERILDVSYGGDLPFDKNKTYIDLLLEQVKNHPDKRAVVAKNGEYTYKQLDQASNVIANYLIAKGVQKRDFVALKMGRVKEFIAAVAGVQKAGGAYIPIDPAYPEDRIEYMLEDSRAKMVITDDTIREILIKETNDSPVNLSEEGIPAYMIYTSGSTGKPKGVVILHHSLSASIAWRKAKLNINENSIHGVHASFSFDASVDDLFTPLAVGGEVHVFGEELRMDLDLIYKYITDNKISGMTMSTQIGLSLVNAHPDLKMDYLLVGGEKCLPCARTNVTLYNGYGPTEFTVASSYHKVDQNKEGDIPIGKAVPNSYSLICDLNGNLLPLGMMGELCLSGIQISEGYFMRPELNKERFIDCKYLKGEKMYRTGDLARYNESGELDYLGRIDFQVKLRGFRIELGEVENSATKFGGVKQAIALVKNKQLVLYYTADDGVKEEELKAHMAEGLTEYMVPSVFMKMEKMPLNPSGKIDRKALPEPARTTGEAVKPRNEEEQNVFDALANILGYDDFGVTDDFDVVGLTSLTGMQFASQLTSLTGKTVKISDFQKYSTIETLINYITCKQEEEAYELQKDYPLTMAQGGILTEVLAHPDTTIYNLPLIVDVPEGVDIVRLENAFTKAIDAHPYLKMRIVSNEKGEFRAERHDDDKIEIHHIDLNELEGGAQSLVKPFNLLSDSLLRAYILKSKNGYKLFFDAHHIVFDGESLDAIFEDIEKAYDGIELKKEEYTEYELALDEQKYRNSEEYESAKDYYRNLLDDKDVDCLPVIDDKTEGVGKVEFDVNFKADRKKVDAFLADSKATINSLWISALGLTLSRFLNRPDALFATVYNGRNDVRIKRAVGMFVHTLPIVCEPFKAETSGEYVKQTAEQLKKNMANDLYGFMEIAHDYGVRADILFVYEGKITQGYKIGGHELNNVQMLTLNQMKSEILLAINDTDDGFLLHVEYNGDRYQQWSMDSLIKATTLAFNELVDGKKVSDVSLITEQDVENIQKYNATEREIECVDIVSAFRKCAEKYPENTAVIFKGKKLTYRQVDEITDRIAAHIAKSGVGRGKVASILISRSEKMVLTTLGVMKTGAAYQPLDSSYPIDRLQFMVKDANASFLIAEEELLDKLPGCNLPMLLTKDFDSLPTEKVSFTGPSFDDLMILLYTSGTTGTPKGVMLTHSNLINFCHWYRRYYGLKPQNVVSAYAGFGFDACMMDLYPALTTGAAVCVVPDEVRMNLDQLAKYFKDNNVTHSFMTTQVGRLFATTNDKSSLKYLSVGGEKLTPLVPPSGYSLFNGYGPTECTIFSTIYPVDKFYNRIPIGKPLDNYKLYVVDSNCHQVPNGALGELWIAGYGVGKGYLNLEEKTKQTFVSNPFEKTKGYDRAYRTGDIVRRLEDGSIDFIGRNDGQVKVRGFRIELGEVEMAVRSFPGIKDATIHAFDAESGGKFLAAYFTADKKIDVSEIKAHILKDKPPYMVPASIMQLDAIPLNQNQKVNKRALPKPVFVDESKEYVAPANDLEKDFCAAFEEILGIEKVGATDSFFDIGGTSLTAARVAIFGANKGYPVSYQDIFKHPSPMELAEYVASNISGDRKPKEKQEIEVQAEMPALKYNDVKYVDEIRSVRKLGRVLLTGATGFLGIHLFKELLDNDIKTIILVRSKDVEPLERVKGLLMYYFDSAMDEKINRLVTVINGDIVDDGLSELLKDYEFDTIVNAAAIVKHFSSDDIIERVNYRGVLNLIKIAKEKNARLVQTSTLSVAGENVDHKFPDDFRMKENQLYFGQDLSNKYANSKFKAEKAILEAVDNDDLDGMIVRLGNLMGRNSDGEFQINNVTNAFMRSLKGYKELKKFPVSYLDKEVDLSPIDETAKTILLLATTDKKFTVFHSFNSHKVQMGDLVDALIMAGIEIEKVDDLTFENAMKEAMADEKKSMAVSSLLSYASSDGLSHEEIGWDQTYSVKALYRLGYRWPITDFDYLEKLIHALITLGFFDRED